jgi:hypothetical protein
VPTIFPNGLAFLTLLPEAPNGSIKNHFTGETAGYSLGTPPQVLKLEKERNVEPFKISRPGQPHRVLPDNRQL